MMRRPLRQVAASWRMAASPSAGRLAAMAGVAKATSAARVRRKPCIVCSGSLPWIVPHGIKGFHRSQIHECRSRQFDAYLGKIQPKPAPELVFRRAAAQAPFPNAALLLQPETVELAGGDRDPIFVLSDPDGLQPVDLRSVAQLSVRVQPPRPQGAIGLEGQSVIPSARCGQPIGVRSHTNRGAYFGLGTIAQLAASIFSPGPQTAIALNRQRVIVAGEHRYPIVVFSDSSRRVSD